MLAIHDTVLRTRCIAERDEAYVLDEAGNRSDALGDGEDNSTNEQETGIVRIVGEACRLIDHFQG
jgi:hypothetical protein